MHSERSRALAMALLIAMIAAAVALPVGPSGLVLADDKGKQATDKSKKEGVPAQCARLIKASERQRCLAGQRS